MIQCWKENYKERPSFSHITKEIEKVNAANLNEEIEKNILSTTLHPKLGVNQIAPIGLGYPAITRSDSIIYSDSPIGDNETLSNIYSLSPALVSETKPIAYSLSPVSGKEELCQRISHLEDRLDKYKKKSLKHKQKYLQEKEMHKKDNERFQKQIIELTQ